MSLLGTIACPTGKNAAVEPVTLYERQSGAGASSFAVVGTTPAKADGSYEFTAPAVDTNTIFRVRAGRRGAHTTVKVAPEITLASAGPSAQTSSTRGQARGAGKATFTGNVSPTSAGAVVVLQVAYPGSGEQWRSVALGHVGADGTYSIAHRFRTPGEMTIRAVVHPGKLNTPAASDSLTYEVSQPQNPQLTVQTSADPIAYGQSVTISGVAAGAASQQVTLLARTGPGAFAVAAQATTDAAGNYSFIQTPLQNTYYRVIDSAAKSTILFEGVRYALTVAALPAASQTGQQVTFAGTVAPGAAGDVVYLQRRSSSGIGFHVVASTTVNADLTYAISYTFHHASTEVLRIKIPSDVGHQATASEPLTMQVTAAAEGSPDVPAPSSEAP